MRSAPERRGLCFDGGGGGGGGGFELFIKVCGVCLHHALCLSARISVLIRNYTYICILAMLTPVFSHGNNIKLY
jgi:hypothetical protein